MSLDVDISLEFASSFALRARFTAGGGITALFGPSGAGKTLTLRCIAGLARPDAGRISLADRPLFDSESSLDLPPRDRSVGYVFQQYALFPHLNVERNVGFGISRLTKEERSARVASLLEIMDLGRMAKRMPTELSGGQQQRVALARALATQPALLMLDEPFAAVDLRVRRRLRAELVRIHELVGTPMLLVTHDIDEVRQLAQSLVLMDAGHVVRSGPTAEILNAPLDPVLADLFE